MCVNWKRYVLSSSFDLHLECDFAIDVIRYPATYFLGGSPVSPYMAPDVPPHFSFKPITPPRAYPGKHKKFKKKKSEVWVYYLLSLPFFITMLMLKIEAKN